ncbi:hypothetical protein ACHHYP_06133 [Achlya hypogyna]|uniref:UDENN domain-containing protein n=1 Tax=Achlya hypogyna TaxID=1202772 RepID=A0A1V9YVM8_ACHHY|nr:hypothetical protein ACHHYP_06133 [Achlya hypogyna]
MRQVHVVLHEDATAAVYKGWVPDEYTARHLIVQVLLYWELLGTTDVNGCRLLPVAAGATAVALDTELASVATLRFCLVTSPTSALPSMGRLAAVQSADDEVRVRALFRIYALQNPWGCGGTTINWQQFKAMTRWHSPHRARQVQWDTAQMLAFKSRASPAGLNLGAFLHAWAYLGTHYPRDAFRPCSNLSEVFARIAGAMARPSLDAALDQCADQAWTLALPGVRRLLQRFAKALHYLLTAFGHRTGDATIDFTAFTSFWAALRFGQHYYVTAEEVATAFVHVSAAPQLAASAVVDVLLHLTLLALPRLLPAALPLETKAGMAAAHRALLRSRSLDAAYPELAVKLFLQHLAQQLTPTAVAAVCRRVGQPQSFYRGAQALHRAFLGMFHDDGDCDYMEAARQAWLLERATDDALVQRAAALLGSATSPPMHDPLATADGLYANMIPQLGRNDVESAVEAWAAATELYDTALTRATAEGVDDTHAALLFRFASSLSVTAFQIAKTHTTTMATFALEIAQMAAAKFHAYWAYLCLKQPDDGDDVRIFQCLVEWAHALVLAADLAPAGEPDAALAATLATTQAATGATVEFWGVPTDASRAMSYHEAARRLELALSMRMTEDVRARLVYAKSQLVLHLPLGTAAQSAEAHACAREMMDHIAHVEAGIPPSLAALRFVTEVFCIRHPSVLVPIYQSVVDWVVATYGRDGELNYDQVNAVNALCDCPPVTSATMAWLCATFNPRPGPLLSGVGFAAYLAYLARAGDPEQFASVLRTLSDEYSRRRNDVPLVEPTPTAAISLPSSAPKYASKLRATIARAFLEITASPPIVRRRICAMGCADEPVPDQIATFCFPNRAVALCPRFVDTVLTDSTGSAIYVACLYPVADGDADTDRCFAIVSSFPYFTVFHDVLAAVAAAPSLPDTALRSFLATTTPAATLSFLNTDIGVVPPPRPFLPCQVPFALLLHALSVEHIVLILLYLLTERRVVVVSSNPSLLTPLCETLRALQAPFASPAVYVPVLPSTLGDFVHAPVPFLMGLVAADSTDATLRGLDLVVVNVDVDAIAVPRGRRSSLPTYDSGTLQELTQYSVPRKAFKAIVRSVSQLATEHGLLLRAASSPATWRETLCSYGAEGWRAPAVLAAWEALQEAFTAFHLGLVHGYEAFYHPPTAGARGRFDADGYLAAFPNKRGFCEAFFETQTFAMFLDQPLSVSEHG